MNDQVLPGDMLFTLSGSWLLVISVSGGTMTFLRRRRTETFIDRVPLQSRHVRKGWGGWTQHVSAEK
jgi:hypothetical protein